VCNRQEPGLGFLVFKRSNFVITRARSLRLSYMSCAIFRFAWLVSISDRLALKVRHWVVSRFTLHHQDRISETSAIKSALCYHQVKVTFTVEEAMMTQSGNWGIAVLYSFGVWWEWVLNAPPRLGYARGRHPVLFYTRLFGTQGRSGRVRKISPPPGFDPWTVQPVQRGYTHYAVPAHTVLSLRNKIYTNFERSWKRDFLNGISKRSF
jgi:hypothetical protein